MFAFVFFMPTFRAFDPMACFILAPAISIKMINGSDRSANITYGITVVIVCMNRKLCNRLDSGPHTSPASIRFFALILASGFFCYDTFIPAMVFICFFLTDGADMLVLLVICLGPVPIFMLRDRRDLFRSCSFANGTGIYLFAFILASGFPH